MLNSNPVNIAVVDGKTITQTTALDVANAGKPIRIKAIANGKYILAEGDKGIAPENITIKRVGKDLHVALEGTDPDQPHLIIEGFFDNPGQLVGVAEDGTYHEYIASDAEQEHSAAFLIDGVSSPQVLGAEELVGFGDGLVAGGAGIGWFWPALLGLAGVGLLGAAKAGSGSGDDNSGSINRPDTPGLSDVTDNVGTVQGPLSQGGVTDDTTPTLKGKATANSTVNLYDGGVKIGSTTSDASGNWTFTPSTALGDGDHRFTAKVVTAAGGESAPTAVFGLNIDTTAPGKPGEGGNGGISTVNDDVGTVQGPIVK
ncbi:Ig-like domain-containing protein, partial [Pseudomonas sp. NPDC087346]|uniref:Ig-like domain-containing protein n=1 Tax=Pseudomonas sp. NPDC087346 TaxID=3364438 RepID=UPI0037F98050